ncbi:hypothetical protein P3339_08275 [Microbulbifer sp. MLAF003]|uniref:hypothetical protein n=1 Tax=unclassified Microbulbifer TaxID=2619833 RepID=UPI0024AC8B91|nr:hypothetical protein [Microbulbifer sp. MLAF003]WHI52745.1 hypothetical protein P3339_08275 [Microbulbifer sp. MLAF003]
MWDDPVLPNIEEHFWEIRNVEFEQQKNPETFEIPSKEDRFNLKRGQAAKLAFDIETQDGDGSVQVSGERMWVIVLKKTKGHYLGILDNEPSCIEPGSGYLEPGCKLWFKPEHVIGIDNPPMNYLTSSYPNEFST